MGVPEWMLSVDSRKISLLHNGACIQMLMHFKGPIAHQMELDLSRLIAGARLDSPTLSIIGYNMPKRKKLLAYRVCGVRDPNEKNSKRWFFYRWNQSINMNVIISGRRGRFGGSSFSGSVANGVISFEIIILQAIAVIFVRVYL